jgi:integrase
MHMSLTVDQEMESPTRCSPVWGSLPKDVADFQRLAMAANTGLAYRSDWRQFDRWCRLRGVASLPATPQTVAAYLAAQANLADADGSWTYAPNTLGRRLAAITKAHEVAGLLSPCRNAEVTTTMSGIRRQRQSPPRRAAPLLLAELRAVLGRIELQRFPEAVIGRRDAALLVMGFAGAFRRSELVELTVDDAALHPQDGLHVRLRHSKTDQEGRGEVKALPYGMHPDTCSPCAYLRWRQVLDGAEIGGRVEVLRLLRGRHAQEGLAHICRDPDEKPSDGVLAGDRPLFRSVHKTGIPGSDALSGHAVGAVVKRRAAAAGLNPARFSGHSLRAGFVTQAVRGGADAGSIMRQTGHRSDAMVELYRRENAPLIGNAVTILGL